MRPLIAQATFVYFNCNLHTMTAALNDLTDNETNRLKIQDLEAAVFLC